MAAPRHIFTTPGRVLGILALLATLAALGWLLHSDRISATLRPLAEGGLILLAVAVIAIGAGFLGRKK